MLSQDLVRPFGELLGGQLSEPAQRFFSRQVRWFASAQPFTTTQAASKDTASRRSVSGWLAELCEAGVVEQLEPRRGNKPALWELTGLTPGDLAANRCMLPTVEEVFGAELTLQE